MGTPNTENGRGEKSLPTSLKQELPFPNAILYIMDGEKAGGGNYYKGSQMVVAEEELICSKKTQGMKDC